MLSLYLLLLSERVSCRSTLKLDPLASVAEEHPPGGSCRIISGM